MQVQTSEFGFWTRLLSQNLYMVGLMDIDTALLRLSEHRLNNQMCILNQSLVEKYLFFDGTESI